MIKDGHGNLTGMIEERVIDQLRPDVSLEEQLSTDSQDAVPRWVLQGNGISYVIYGVNHFDI